MLSSVSHGKCRIRAVGCMPTLTSLGRCGVSRGLEMLSEKRVVLFQAFATKPEAIIICLFQGVVQN